MFGASEMRDFENSAFASFSHFHKLINRVTFSPCTAVGEICAHWVFVWNLILNNFYLKDFFNMINIFCSIEAQNESTFPFQYIIIFKNGNRWRSLAPVLGEIEICVHRVFCIKFNSALFLFEGFFDITDIFCSIQP